MSWQMRVFATGLSVAAVVLLLVGQAQAGDKVNKKDAAARAQALALFQKALAVSDIRAPGSPPFELRGTIDVRGGDKKDESGTYDLKWASPEQWREEIRFADYWQTRVGGKDQYWQARGGQFQFAPIVQIGSALDFLKVLRFWAKPASIADLGRVTTRSRKMEGRKISCVMLVTKGFESGLEYCFDAEMGTWLGNGNKTLTYSQFAAFAGKQFPRTIHIPEFSKETIEFNASSISPLVNSDAMQFIPSENAQVWPSCDSPDSLARVIRQTHPFYPEDAIRGGMQGTVWFYAVIGADGRVHNLQKVGTPNLLLANAAAAAMAQWEYKPEMCGGHPVPAETLLEANFSL